MRKYANNIILLYLLLIVSFFCISCKDSPNVRFVYPERITWTYYGEDTIANQQKCHDFTIVKYIDDKGCIPCIMEYQRLTAFRAYLNSVKHIVDIQLIFNSNNIGKIIHIAKSENIIDPIAIDSKAQFISRNPFLKGLNIATFLIDKNNNVLATGDPCSDEKVYNQYKSLILGESSSVVMTDAEVSNRILEIGQFPKNVKKRFILTIINTGNRPLVINDVIVGCGCLQVEFDKKVILPHKKTMCHVSVITNEVGFFSKNVTILSNSENPLHFKVIGNVI